MDSAPTKPDPRPTVLGRSLQVAGLLALIGAVPTGEAGGPTWAIVLLGTLAALLIAGGTMLLENWRLRQPKAHQTVSSGG